MVPALAIAGQVAQGVGDIAGGFTAARGARLSPAQEQLLAELRKRKKQGELGLSDKERSTMENRLSAPLAAQEREQNARFSAGMTIDDAGAGAGAKAFQGDLSRRAERRLGVGQAINDADVAREATNRDMLLKLDSQAQTAKNAKRAAWINLATAGLATAANVGKVAGPAITEKKDRNEAVRADLAQALGREVSDDELKYFDLLED
mgnify:CR=1 FL=1|tara:strand:+ start:1008 stop:1625 length:618 start_codon:yes stop_codon:yes gene_type:complete